MDYNTSVEIRPTPPIVSAGMSPDELAQLAEVAELLRVSKRTALKYARLPSFPAPVETLKTGRIWSRSAVVTWGKANLKRQPDGKRTLPPGRPRKQP